MTESRVKSHKSLDLVVPYYRFQSKSTYLVVEIQHELYHNVFVLQCWSLIADPSDSTLSFTLHDLTLYFSVGAKTQPESKCPELLANYCDMLLRKTPLSKKLTSEEVEKKLRDVVSTRHSIRTVL